MNFDLPKDLSEWQTKVRQFVETELQPRDEEIERTGVVSKQLLEKIGNLGLFGTHTPRRYGGLGLSMLGSCLAIEEIAKAHKIVLCG